MLEADRQKSFLSKALLFQAFASTPSMVAFGDPRAFLHCEARQVLRAKFQSIANEFLRKH
jgi:hypothetical protein